MIRRRYFTKLLFALIIFLTSTGIYQSTAYSFFNPIKYFKGSLAEGRGDKAYENKNYPAAFAEYKKAADDGSPYGQFMLANMYLTGQSVDKEHGSAMHMLGMMYAKGVGVSKNTDEAVRWFRLAKVQGVPVPDQLLTQSGIEASFKKGSTPKKPDTLIQDIQQRLINLDYNPGPADGLYGKKTRVAIKAFQQKNGFEPDGLATVNVLEALKNLSQYRFLNQKKEISTNAVFP